MRLTIRAKLFLIFFSLGLLPLLISVFFAYSTMSDAMVAQSNEQITKLADKTAEQIQFFFESREKEIMLLANYPFIQLAFLQFEFDQRLDTVGRLLKAYETKNRYFNNIYLTDLHGKTILVVPEKRKNKLPLPAVSTGAGTGTKNDLRTTYVSARDNAGSPAVFISRRVYDFEDAEKPVGTITFDITPEAFVRFVSSVKIGNHGYACLWDHQGLFVYHPQMAHTDMKDLLESSDSSLTHLIARILDGERGQGNYEYNGVRKRMFFTPCNVLGWRVTISLETSDLMADIIALRYRMLSFCGVLAFLLLIASYAFGKSLSMPINRLIRGARAIGDGQWDYDIKVDSGDELQLLADEFNKMTGRLRKSIDEIIELKNFNEDVLRSVPSGIITMDRDLAITSLNAGAAETLRFPMDHVRLPLLQNRLAAENEDILDLLKQCVRKNINLTNHQIERFPRDGSKGSATYLELNTSSLKNAKDETVGAIAIIRDITQRKEIEEQMIRVDRLASLGELSAGMAHEIRNPLAGMKTATQILARNISDASGKILINGILSEIDRLNKIVTDLLNFSRPKKPMPAAVDLSEVVEKSLALVGKSLKHHDIRLIKSLDRTLPPARVDREQIEQIFLNILLNAVKAMPQGGTLSITSAVGSLKKDNRGQRQYGSGQPARTIPRDYPLPLPGKRIEIIFQDNGHGIKAEYLSKIFNPFYTTDPGGTGLGLSIVQKLLEENQGEITIHSRENLGTRVILSFQPCRSFNV